MAEATGHIRVETIIDDSLKAALGGLSQSIGNTTARITALNSVSKRLNDSSRAVTESLRVLSETEGRASTVSNKLAVSQVSLASYLKKVKQESIAASTAINSMSSSSSHNSSAIQNNIQKIKQLEMAQKSLNKTMASGAMRDISRQYNKQATELSYIGQRLTMGLTLPLVAIGRLGFSSLKKLNQEEIRTKKLLNDTGMEAGILEGKMKSLGDQLDKISFKWGVSRELLQGLAGDFAELGISDPTILANLVQITNEIEKLGNVDITEANDLTKSVYQNILRLRRLNNQDVTSETALKNVVSQVRGAVALFNFAENKTSLSLKDIAQSFPEVQSAATSFGLSLSTTAALLVPMVSAGIKTGTAANSLKVSLQRAIVTTKDFRKIQAALNEELGPKFKTSIGIGAQGIQDLVDAFSVLSKSKYGEKGTLQLFAKAFGVRQGPRIDIAVQQMADFQKQLENVDSAERKIISSLEDSINAKLVANNIDKIKLKNIKDISDLSILATETDKNATKEQIAANGGLTKRAQLIKKAQEEEIKGKKRNFNLQKDLNKITTESGKILIGGAFGTELTGQTMEAELLAAEKSLNVQVGKVREAFKSMARDFTVAFGDILTTIGPILKKIALIVKDLSPNTKKLIGLFALFLLSIGPVIRIFSLFKQAASVATFGMAKGMMFGKTKAIELNQELLRVNGTFLKLGKKNSVSEIGGKLIFSGKQKVFDRAQQLVSMQASRDPNATGIISKMQDIKIKRLERRLGVSSREANYAGLKPDTATTLRGLYAQASAVPVPAAPATVVPPPAVITVGKAPSQQQSPKAGVDTFMKSILNAIKSLLQEIAKCTCAKNPMATGKPTPGSGTAPSNGPNKPKAPAPAGTGAPSKGVAVPSGTTTTTLPSGRVINVSPGATPTQPSTLPAGINPFARFPSSVSAPSITPPVVKIPKPTKEARELAKKVAKAAKELAAESKKAIAQAEKEANKAAREAENAVKKATASAKKQSEQLAKNVKKYADELAAQKNKVLEEANKVKTNIPGITPFTRVPVSATTTATAVPTPTAVVSPAVVSKATNTVKAATDAVTDSVVKAGTDASKTAIVVGTKGSSAKPKPVAKPKPAVQAIVPPVQEKLKEILGRDMFGAIKGMGFNMPDAQIGRAGAVNFQLGKEQLVGMFKEAGQVVPDGLKRITELVDHEGKKLRITLDQMVKIFDSIQKGNFSKLISGELKPTTESVRGLTGAAVNSPLNKAMRNLLGGTTRVEAGAATYLDLGKTSGRAREATDPRRAKKYRISPAVVALQELGLFDKDQYPVDRKANNVRAKAMLAGYSRTKPGGIPDKAYSELRRSEFSPEKRYEELISAPVGIKKVRGFRIPTNVTLAPAKVYEAFANQRAKMIADVRKAQAKMNEELIAAASKAQTEGAAGKNAATKQEIAAKAGGVSASSIPTRNRGVFDPSTANKVAVEKRKAELVGQGYSPETIKRMMASFKRTLINTTVNAQQNINEQIAEQEAKVQKVKGSSKSVEQLKGVEKELKATIESLVEKRKQKNADGTKVALSEKENVDLKNARDALKRAQAQIRKLGNVDDKTRKADIRQEEKKLKDLQKKQRKLGPKPLIPEAPVPYKPPTVPNIPIIGRPATAGAPANVGMEISAEQRAFNIAKARLTNLSQLKMDIEKAPSMPAGVQDSLNREIERSLKTLGVKKKSLEKEIKTAEETLRQAQEKLSATMSKPLAGGGGSVGGVSMLNDPLMGGDRTLGPRGRVPRVGPRIASMTTGAITGGVSSVYGEIQTSLNIPADVMKQVISKLAEKHNLISGVGKTSVTEINGKVDQLIEALKKQITDPAKATVDEITKAITDARALFTKLETPALKATRLGAPTSAPSAPIAQEELFRKYPGKASDAQVNKIVERLQSHNTSVEQLMQLDDRTLRKVTEVFANANDALKGFGKKTKPERSEILVKTLNNSTKASADLQNATAASVSNNAAVVQKATEVVNSTPKVSNEVINKTTSVVSNLNTAIKAVTTHPLAIIAQVAKAILIQEAAMPTPIMATPIVSKITEAIKILDQSVVQHVTNLAEQIKTVAASPSISRGQILSVGIQKLVSQQVNKIGDVSSVGANALKTASATSRRRVRMIQERYQRLSPGPEKDQAAAWLSSKGQLPTTPPAPPTPEPTVRKSSFTKGVELGQIRELTSGRKKTSIADIPIPKRGSARSYDISKPPDVSKLNKLNDFIGKLVEKTSRITSSKTAQMLDPAGAGLMSGLTSLKSTLLAPLFQRQNSFIPTDYVGQAKSRMMKAQTRRNIDPTTSRQMRKIGQESVREGAAIRGIDRPNEITRMVQGRLPSQFIQSISPMVDKFKAIGSIYAPKVYKATLAAETYLKKTTQVAGRVSKEMIKFPITANVAAGKAIQKVVSVATPGAKALGEAIRKTGTNFSEAIRNAFVNSNFAKNNAATAQVIYGAGKVLSTSIKMTFNGIAGSMSIAAMAIQSPKAAFELARVSLVQAGKNFVNTLTSMKASLVAAGGGSLAKGVAKGVVGTAMTPVKAVGSYIGSAAAKTKSYQALFGGPMMMNDQTGEKTKQGGLFTASKTIDAQGNVAKSGGFVQNMAKAPFAAVASGMKLIGGTTSMAISSVSSLANMMVYKLGPAGFLLMPIMNKVTMGLQAMGAKALLVVLPLLAIFVIFKVLKKGWESFKQYTEVASENFSKIKDIFKEIVDSLKAIFFDFFASIFEDKSKKAGYPLGLGEPDSLRGIKQMGASIDEFSKRALAFAEGFKKIFQKYIAPFIYQFLAGFALIIKGVVKVFIGIFNFAKAIYQKIKGTGDEGTGALKKGWEALKDGVLSILKGLLKMFAGVFKLLINIVFKFVEYTVQMFEFLGFAVVNVIRYMVKGIISLVTGIISIFAFIVDKVIEAFVGLQTGIIKIYKVILKVGVEAGAGLIQGFLFAVQKILDAFGYLLLGIGKIFGAIPSIIGAVFDFLAEKSSNIPLIGGTIAKAFRSVGGVFSDIGDGVDSVATKAKDVLVGLLDPVKEGIDDAKNGILNTLDTVSDKAVSIVSTVGKLGDLLRNAIADAGDASRDAVDGAADSVNRLIGSASDGINALRKAVIDWLDSFSKGDAITKGLGDKAREALDEGIKNVDPEALSAAGEDIANAVQQGLKDLKTNFFEKVVDNLGKALEKQKNKLTDALNVQKDNQLKIFDDQIAAIDALAAAEERLTATIEFENQKREAEAERSLQKKNYEKQRALAIYEGRIDDARSLDQEEQKNRKDAEKSLKDLGDTRNKTLQSEQRETAKTIIGQQKTKAATAFDAEIKAFEDFAANVLAKGTLTQAELESQFLEISSKAGTMSTNMQASFAAFYTALPEIISANTEPTIGFFNTGLQGLVDAATAKFGLGTETADPASILGATKAMLEGSTSLFTTLMPAVVAEYSAGTTALAQVGIDFANPDNENSPGNIYEKAISDATDAVAREFARMETTASSAFAKVVEGINLQLKDLAIAEAIAKATEGLKKVVPGAETPTTTSPTVPGNPPPPPSNLTSDEKTLYNDAIGGVALIGFNPYTSFAPGAPAQKLSKVSFNTQAGKDGYISSGNKAAYVSNIKKALRFYGATLDTTDTLGTTAAKEVASFQSKYGLRATGQVNSSTADALGLFSQQGVPKKYYGGAIKRMMGGPIGAYGAGGDVPGFSMKAVPALLHGGEYVISSKAVQNLGSGFLGYLNSLKYGLPKFNVPTPTMPNISVNQNINVNGGNSETIHNYNFYVDNFIGEDKWFEGMMNEYNVKVVPNKQKSAGLESRVIRSYNGINKGM